MRAVALSRHSQFSKCERGSQTPERAGALRAPLSHADRLDPHAAFPDMRSRSLNIYSVSKNVPDRNPSGLRLHANTRLVGLAAFSGSLCDLELVPSKRRYLIPPTSPHQGATRRVPITALVKCEDKTLLFGVNRSQNRICRSRLCS